MSNHTMSINNFVSSYAYIVVSNIINTATNTLREKIALDNLKFTRTSIGDTPAELRYHLTQMERARARRYSDKGIFTRFVGKNGAYFIHQNQPWEIHRSNRRWTPNEHLEEH